MEQVHALEQDELPVEHRSQCCGDPRDEEAAQEKKRDPLNSSAQQLATVPSTTHTEG